jgi:hypothetical protein
MTIETSRQRLRRENNNEQRGGKKDLLFFAYETFFNDPKYERNHVASNKLSITNDKSERERERERYLDRISLLFNRAIQYERASIRTCRITCDKAIISSVCVVSIEGERSIHSINHRRSSVTK